jgi:prepilin-type N-terminal cleavage/methylation domain-containing protein
MAAMRKGVTLPELILVLAIIALLLALALPRLAGWLDQIAVDRAAQEIAAFHGTARFTAIARSQRVRLDFSPDSLRATLEGPTDSVFLRWPGPARHGVSLTASRAMVRFQPNGLGLGAANTKLVLRRGAAAESLTTSLLGRLRRWR